MPTATPSARKRGVKPAPRYQFNPYFVRHVRADGRPIWLLTHLAGFSQITVLSSLLHAPVVIATPLVVERLRRLADAVGFPPDQIFLNEQKEVAW
jgi:hypothetical protein